MPCGWSKLAFRLECLYDAAREEGEAPVSRSRRGARAEALNGILLAAFWQRLLGYGIDLLVAVIVWGPVEFAWRHFLLHEPDIHLVWDFHEPGNIVVMVLYWGLTNYFCNGQTPGKWVARTRIVSLAGERLGLWQSIERGLGYGAAVLELGLGFLQFFWDPNRMCAQDRLAETIVIDVRRPKVKAKDDSAAQLHQEVSAQRPTQNTAIVDVSD